jgi:hypothetical protein
MVSAVPLNTLICSAKLRSSVSSSEVIHLAEQLPSFLRSYVREAQPAGIVDRQGLSCTVADRLGRCRCLLVSGNGLVYVLRSCRRR